MEYLVHFGRKDEEKAPGNIKGKRKEERNQGQEEKRVRKQQRQKGQPRTTGGWGEHKAGKQGCSGVHEGKVVFRCKADKTE